VRWPAGVCRVDVDSPGGVMKNFTFWMTWAIVFVVLALLFILAMAMLP